MSTHPTASSPSSTASSRASSPTSSAGVYVPVHRRRCTSASSSRSAESTTPRKLLVLSSNSSVEPSPRPVLAPQFYTPADLLQLAQSPLAMQLSSSMQPSLQAFVEITTRKRPRERSVEGPARTRTAPVIQLTANPPRRYSANRRNNLIVASKIVDAASWRREPAQVPEALQTVPTAI
ncbi:hypothetical protein C8R44DRAFT_868768 [Mycena epipterygia]|nr:hypothetical protein C8R44DRAFT_868768 [Mycena epipterygia]